MRMLAQLPTAKSSLIRSPSTLSQQRAQDMSEIALRRPGSAIQMTALKGKSLLVRVLHCDNSQAV